MSDLVLGGTGRVGRAVVEGLLARNREVRVLTRSPERVRTLPDAAGAVVGNLLDPRSFAATFAGVQRVFLLNGISQSELQEGLVAVNEARRSGVQRLVYLSVYRAERGSHVPHFASKVAIEAAVRSSGIPYTILRPNHFFQNDLWGKDAVLGYGVYPHPIGSAGLSRVDLRDVAEAAVTALTQPGHEGKTYHLVGPEVLTGQETAHIYSEALGREVYYGGDDLSAWERVALTGLPAWMVYDLKLMYALLQEEGLRATPAEVEQTSALLGRPPRRFVDFAREVAASWTTSTPYPLPTQQ
jgi:uncharacterized protein YbjT (DUF2867 family)